MDEQVIYEQFISQWLEVVKISSPEEVVTMLSTQTPTIYQEVLNTVNGDKAMATRITQRIVEDIPTILSKNASLSLGGRRVTKFANKEEWKDIQEHSGYDFGGAEYPYEDQLLTVVDIYNENEFKDFGYDNPYIQQDISDPEFNNLEQKPFINVSNVLRYAGITKDKLPDYNKLSHIATNIDKSLSPGGTVSVFDFKSIATPLIDILTSMGYIIQNSEEINLYEAGEGLVDYDEFDIKVKLVKPINKEGRFQLKLKKRSWDMGGQKSDEYHPGSNVAGPVPFKTPRSPSDLSRSDQWDRLDYSTPSIVERDFAEEHPGVSDRGSDPGSSSGGGSQSHTGQPGRSDNIYPEPMNWLRPFKKMPISPFRYNLDFNEDFDTEYTQRQYGDLSLLRQKKGVSEDPMVSPEGWQHVCAYHTDDQGNPLLCWMDETGMIARPVTPEEAASGQLSHGICQECAETELTKYRQMKGGVNSLSLNKKAGPYYMPPEDPEDPKNQLWWRGIRKTLTNPTTTEDVLWTLALEHNLSPDILALTLEHPNLQDTQKRDAIQQWLDNIDQATIKDFGDGDGDIAIAPKDEEFAPDIEDIQGTEFPPESDERREQTKEAPRLSSQEASMVENYSSDEIWNMAIQNDVIAQQLIEKGIVASYARLQKQALIEWTDIADDFLVSRETPQARHILSLVKQEVAAGNLNSVNDFGRIIFDEFPEYRGDAVQLRRFYNMLLDNNILHDTEAVPESTEPPWWKEDLDKEGQPGIYETTPRFIKPEEPQEEVEDVPEKDTSWWRSLFSSVIDAPRDVLDPAIWQDGTEEIPMLRPRVKVQIVERFFDYIHRFGGYIRPELWVKNMFYTGSTATFTYSEHADIDIHVVVDWHDMLIMNPDRNRKDLQEVWKELHDTFWWTLNKLKLEGTKHPMQYYVMPPGDESKIVEQKEEIYDIGHDLWLIPPAKGSEVPEEVLQEAVETSSDIMRRIDEQISDARKGLIDYALLTEVITPENAGDMYQQLAQKVREIDEGLKNLKKEYDYLKTRRQMVFQDTTVNSNFSLDNVIFKFIERYRYMDVLRKVKRITNDMDLAPDQVPDIADVFGLSDLFKQEIR